MSMCHRILQQDLPRDLPYRVVVVVNTMYHHHRILQQDLSQDLPHCVTAVMYAMYRQCVTESSNKTYLKTYLTV